MSPSSGDLAACQRISTRFYLCLDTRDYEGLIALFAPDGVWHRQGRALSGAAEMRTALEARSATFEIRHVLTATDVQAESDGSITVEGYVLVFRQALAEDASHPLPMPEGPSTLTRIRDCYTRIDAAWKLAEKAGARVFARI